MVRGEEGASRRLGKRSAKRTIGSRWIPFPSLINLPSTLLISFPETKTTLVACPEENQMGAATAPLLRTPDVIRIVDLSSRYKEAAANGVTQSSSPTIEWTGPTDELFGYPIEEIENTEEWWLRRVHPEDQEAVRHSIGELLIPAPNSPFAAESRISAQDYRFKHANGHYLMLSDRTIVNRDSNGEANRLESVVFDKEKRKAQRESFSKVFEAQNHLAVIANNTQSGIFMMDPRGYCIYMNSVAEKITGFTFQEIYDYTFHASVHSCRPDGSFFPIYECPVFCHQQAGTAAKNESEVFVHKDGHHYDIEYSVSPIGEYSTGGAVIEFRDVTEQKKLERERLNAILMTEQQSIQIKADVAHKTNMTSFVSFVCHELRNPLQGVTSSAEFLLETLQRMESLTNQLSMPLEEPKLESKENLPQSLTNFSVNKEAGSRTAVSKTSGEKDASTVNAQMSELRGLVTYAKELVAQVSTCAEHQALITNNVLDLSRLDAGKLEPSFDVLDARDAGRQSILMMSAKAQHKQIKLSMKDTFAEPVYLKIDMTILRQVLLNLISNAIKFTQNHGSITLDFHVSPPDINGRVMLHSSVTDDGLGMTESEQKNLFQRFSQANRRVAQLYGGSGLGLSISKELVRVMGGEMHVKSEKGKGSTFSFTSIHDQPSESELVAIQEEHSTAVEVTASFVNEITASKEVPEIAPPKFRTVGVAEDNPINLKILATHMTKLGYQFVLCTNGQEILDKVCEPNSAIDCCILDMSMPVMDGLEASRKIREHESSAAINRSQRMPIIALSGNALNEQVTAAMDSGCSDYLVKPCKQLDLAKRLAYWERIVHSRAEHRPMLDMSFRG
jgi:PAS domain S-box-containing protein